VVAEHDDVPGNASEADAVDEFEAEPAAPGLALAGASADAHLQALFEDFFVARKPLKGSPHTEAAYRGDLTTISAQLATALGIEPGELRLGQVTTKSLRRAFAAYSDSHSAASIARAWAAWNQFFRFLVADEVVVGNPMAAVAKPKVPARALKALQGRAPPNASSKPLPPANATLASPGPSATSPLWPRRCLLACAFQSSSAWTWARSTAGRGNVA
jgi:integrase